MPKKSSLSRCAAATLLAIGLAATSGCRTLSESADAPAEGPFGAFGAVDPASLNPLAWGADSDEPRRGAPDRIVATWTETVRHTQGEPAVRGFGGRLYFYDRAADPIAVDGQLVVYAFDESNRAPTDHKPTRRFVFPAEQFERHLSRTEIGTSYSVWLPWDEANGPTSDISLIARFEPVGGGGLVVSDQATQRLPGRDMLPPAAADTQLVRGDADSSRVRQAAYRPTPPGAVAGKPSRAPEGESKRRLTTTTINLRR